jgi:uncharacterized protein (TIGR00661 family)
MPAAVQINPQLNKRPQRSLRVLLYVQGEGRGHMTQAIAITRLLEQQGHQIVGVGIGKPSSRTIPDYVKEAFDGKLIFIYKTLEIFYRKGRSLNQSKTASRLVVRTPYYLRSMRNVRRRWQKLKPDLIINFFEPVAGLTLRLGRSPCPVLALSHQNLFLASDTYMLQGKWADRCATTSLARLSGSRAELLALSLIKFPIEGPVTLCPPLLRQETLEAKATQGDYVLIYLLNTGYMDDIRRLHARFPHIPFRCFVAHEGQQDVIWDNDKLSFHKIDGKAFQQAMCGCACLISTAGFESTAEAALLGKPMGVVPVEGHYEQLCNAHDVERSGLGMWSHRFDFDVEALIHYDNAQAVERFRQWAANAQSIFIAAVERACERSEDTA